MRRNKTPQKKEVLQKDRSRFVDVTELAGIIGTDTITAMDLAERANAVMKMGSGTWYDKDKVIAYQKLQSTKKETLDIKWFGKVHSCIGNKTDDVSITLDKTNRLRVRFLRKCIANSDKINNMVLGLYENRMYFNSSDKGFTVRQVDQTVISFTCKAKDTMSKFVGRFPLHYEDGLMYIDLEDKTV